MILIDTQTFETLVCQKIVSNFTIHKENERRWYLTFTMPDTTANKTVMCSIRTQKGTLREWADVRTLLKYLKKYKILIGQFRLDEGLMNDFKKQIQFRH